MTIIKFIALVVVFGTSQASDRGCDYGCVESLMDDSCVSAASWDDAAFGCGGNFSSNTAPCDDGCWKNPVCTNFSGPIPFTRKPATGDMSGSFLFPRKPLTECGVGCKLFMGYAPCFAMPTSSLFPSLPQQITCSSALEEIVVPMPTLLVGPRSNPSDTNKVVFVDSNSTEVLTDSDVRYVCESAGVVEYTIWYWSLDELTCVECDDGDDCGCPEGSQCDTCLPQDTPAPIIPGTSVPSITNQPAKNTAAPSQGVVTDSPSNSSSNAPSGIGGDGTAVPGQPTSDAPNSETTDSPARNTDIPSTTDDPSTTNAPSPTADSSVTDTSDSSSSIDTSDSSSQGGSSSTGSDSSLCAENAAALDDCTITKDNLNKRALYLLIACIVLALLVLGLLVYVCNLRSDLADARNRQDGMLNEMSGKNY